MATTVCSGCGKQLAEADVLYNAQGNTVCQACNDQQDVAKALHVPVAGVYVAPPSQPGAVTREYEFDGAENAIINGLAKPMRFVGGMTMAFGILAGLGGVAAVGMGSVGGIGTLIEGFLMVLVGSWLLPAARALDDVVTTEGNDVTNLMYALKKLANVFLLQAILWGIAIVGVALVVLLVLLRSAK